MTAGEVIQALARAPFDTPVLVHLPNGPRFHIDVIELSTHGEDRWEIEVKPNLAVTESA